MGINKQSDVVANLQIGATSLGMVRIYIEGDGFEVPLDFEPDEALEIAEELRLAAAQARHQPPRQPRAAGPQESKRGRNPAKARGSK